MSQNLESLTKDPAWLWQELNRRVKLCPSPDAMQRLTAHVREKTGKNTIVAFYNNGATVEEKAAVLKECLTAVVKNDFSTLLGAVANGQAQTPEKEPEPAPEPQEAPGVPKAVEAKTEPEPMKAPKRGITPAPPSDRAAVLAQLIAQLTETQPFPPAVVDPDEVRKIATEIVESHLKEQVKDMRGIIADHGNQLRQQVEAHLAKIPPRDVVEIRKWDGTVHEIERQHWKFPLLLAALSQRLNVLLVGPAGSSKTTAAHAASTALKLPFEAMSVGPMTSKADLFGFKDANGKYHDTATVRRAVSGGVMLWDEVDAANAGVLTAGNMLLANGHVATPEGMQTKHADFVLIAAANTYGMGANRVYVGRNQLDGATLDRFVMIDWGYDEGLEAHIVGVKHDSPKVKLDAGGILKPAQWLEYVLQVRAACEKLGIRHVVSPRASIHGVRLFAAGVGREHVEEMVLWKGMEQASRDKIKATL